jgi:hypothetical protein
MIASFKTVYLSTHVLVDEIQATISGDEASNLLAILDELNTHAFTNSRVGLLCFKTAAR